MSKIYIKLPPQREKMSEKLEWLRLCEMRLRVLERDFPKGSETKRIFRIYSGLWKTLSPKEVEEYRQHFPIGDRPCVMISS